MTFQEHIKALPEAERLAFFRSILAISEAGRKGGEKPEVWGKYVAGVFNEVGRLSKEEKNNG
jgi:hypothetical protein